MTESPFNFDLAAGTVRDGALRYLLIRPDVLMGTARKLGHIPEFVRAFEESAYANARESFEVYRAQGKLDVHDFLERTAQSAARLGWGLWSVEGGDGGRPSVIVRNSPFAAGIGHCDVPACGPICGILRALYVVMLGEEVLVQETQCTAQGALDCRFQFRDAIG